MTLARPLPPRFVLITSALCAVAACANGEPVADLEAVEPLVATLEAVDGRLDAAPIDREVITTTVRHDGFSGLNVGMASPDGRHVTINIPRVGVSSFGLPPVNYYDIARVQSPRAHFCGRLGCVQTDDVRAVLVEHRDGIRLSIEAEWSTGASLVAHMRVEDRERALEAEFL